MPVKQRHDGRRPDEMRPLKITPNFVRAVDGSCLIELGNTRVICTACVVNELPRWRKEQQLGWVTAEYGMLPGSTRERKPRPGVKPDGRSVEIQRLIGRVVRNVVRFEKLGENTVYLDCDVLEADGGTRTASITGAYVALALAVARREKAGQFAPRALRGAVAGVSVGLVDGRAVLDLDYAEDSAAQVDMNVAMTAGGKLVELQGTAEGRAFTTSELEKMLRLARRGIRQLFGAQRRAIAGGLRL
jgi:ribonuclease PH